ADHMHRTRARILRRERQMQEMMDAFLTTEPVVVDERRAGAGCLRLVDRNPVDAVIGEHRQPLVELHPVDQAGFPEQRRLGTGERHGVCHMRRPHADISRRHARQNARWTVSLDGMPSISFAGNGFSLCMPRSRMSQSTAVALSPCWLTAKISTSSTAP